MKIGEVSQRVGVSISALRLYEQRGLIEAGRSGGGTRHYSEADVERFRAIVGLTRAEVSIDALAHLAGIRAESPTGAAASRQVGETLGEIEAELLARIEQLHKAYSDLQLAKTKLAGCHGCRKRPTLRNCTGCEVADDLLKCSVMHIVWDQKSSDA